MQSFVKKFGYEEIARVIPDEDQKLLSYINKMENRKANKKKDATKKKEKKEDDDEDILNGGGEDRMEEEDGEDKEAPRQGKKKTAAWLLENDEPIDFLDVSTAKGVVARDPSKKKKIRNDYTDKDYEYDENGKMIINDSDDEAPKKKKEKGWNILNSMESKY